MQRPHPSLPVRRFHPAARDTWTAHLRRVTSWVAAGSVAAVLALIGLAAHETPSHHTTGSSGATGSTGTGSAGGTTTGGGSGPPPTGGSSTTGAATSGRSSTSAPLVGPSSGGSAHVSTGMS